MRPKDTRKMTREEKRLDNYRQQALKAAKQLQYSEDIITRIRGAVSEPQISQALHTGAERYVDCC